MSKMTGSWLSGPQSVAPKVDQKWPGELLGMTESGPGSIATFGRRVGAIFVDWILAGFLVLLTNGFDLTDKAIGTKVIVAWMLVGIVGVWLFARTPGQAVMAIGVARVDVRDRVGLWRAVVRQLLIVVMIPPLITDQDGRGMHDRATGTALVVTR